MIFDSRKVSAICLVDNGVVLGYDRRQEVNMLGQSERFLASTPAGHEWLPVVLLLALLAMVIFSDWAR
jgi:hypothetical protein